MADFLSRLAARALGAVPVAQPVIPSTFAPDAGLDSGLESHSLEAPAADNVSAPLNILDASTDAAVIAVERLEREVVRQDPRAGTEEVQTGTREAGVGDSTLPRPERAPIAQAHVTTTRHHPAPTPREPRKASVTTAAETPLFVEAAPAGDQGLDARAPGNPHSAVGDRRTESARQRPAAAAEEFHSGAQPVHITIGRVEVRAVLQTPPAARSASSPPRPAVTLEEYGKRRNRGGQ